jgi:hypothetical protein
MSVYVQKNCTWTLCMWLESATSPATYTVKERLKTGELAHTHTPHTTRTRLTGNGGTVRACPPRSSLRAQLAGQGIFVESACGAGKMQETGPLVQKRKSSLVKGMHVA